MAQTPACPRCGYDQRGVIDSWTQSCPLSGICSECGLEFQWRDLLDPRFKIKPMLFEHAQSRYVLSFSYTFWRMLRPWSFWRWVRLEDEISTYRLGVFVFFALPLLSAAALTIMIPIAFACGLVISIGTSWVDPGDVLMNTIFAFSWTYDLAVILPLIGLLAATAIAPGILVLFGDSMKLARVRRVHLLRVWVYSLVCVPCSYCILSFSAIFDWITDWTTDSSTWWLFSVDFYTYRPRPTLLLAVGVAVGIQTLVIHRAVVVYLRLTSGWGVAISVGVITVLLAAIIAVLPMLWVYGV